MGSSEVKYTWPSTVNVANFVTVKPSLDDEERLSNFNIWKKQMLCLVESHDVLGFINGEIPEPQSSNVEYEEQKLWRRTNRLVQGWILGSIGKDALDAVWELETAREVWLELDKIFNEDATNSKLQSESDANNAQDEGGANSELQSESDANNAQDEGGGKTSGDLSRYLPLYKAAQRGDWETAKTNFFDKDNEESKAIIASFSSETALHVAVSTCKANAFVKKLVELTPHDALALKNIDGDTALHCAAMVGNTEAARILVDKDSGLQYILNNLNRLPVQEAAVNGHKDTLEYLLSMSNPNVEHTPFEGQLGHRLLDTVISSEFFDVALDLLDKYPNLTRLRDDEVGPCTLQIMAGIQYVFPSGESFSWWKNLIYRRVPINQSEREAAQVTSFAGDIENTSCDPRLYNNKSSSFQIICGVAQKLESRIWKVMEQLVPQVKDIRDKKAMHQQALELVKYLCLQTLSLPENEALSMFQNSILKAAKYGISEIVEVIIDMYPEALAGPGGRVVFLAATNRYENVCNLIYNTSDRRILSLNAVDDQGNNLMHTCAELAPPDRLNLVPGAALQMQRELLWFKEMEKFVSPSRRKWENIENKTPKMIFTEEHKQLKAEGERWMKDTANACTIAAALIATVVFAAAFTVPGGIETVSGIPIFWDQFAFILFAISDAISLFTSITSLLMFISILTSRYAEEDFLYVLPKRLSIGLLSLFISITFMMVAFSGTFYLVVRRKMSWFLIPAAAFACLPVTSFVLLQFPLLVDVIYSTYGPGIFGKKR